MLYAGIVQSGFALPMLVQAVSNEYEKAITIPVIGLVLSLFGQIGMGYCAAAKRSVAISAAVWIAGCLGTVYGVTLLEVTSVRSIAIAGLQLAGGPIAFALVARSLPDTQIEPRNYMRAMIPVAPVAVFTAAMLALAWFEARREKDLAPARVVG